MEVWKKINGFETYEISNFGKVRSNHYLKKRILKLENSKDYLRVSLSRNNKVKRFLVHRLVAEHFIYDGNFKPCVNHKDGNKINNNVLNLEWCNYSENERHSYDVLGKINAIRKLTNEQANYIKLTGIKGKGGNIKELANNYSVDVSTIYNILKNKYYAQT